MSGIGAAIDSNDMAIVQAVLGLARGLGVPVIAEGVETETQLRALRQAGCEEVQGWLIGRPAPIESFSHLTGGAVTRPGLFQRQEDREPVGARLLESPICG